MHPNQPPELNFPSPNNPDIAWMQERATGKKAISTRRAVLGLLRSAVNVSGLTFDGNRSGGANARLTGVYHLAASRTATKQGIDIMSLAFSRDGQKLMAGLDFGPVKVWELTGTAREVSLEGHRDQVRGLALLPDGRTLVSAAHDIRFWDLNSGRQLSVVEPRATGFLGCSVSADGRRLAIGAADGRITIWNLVSGQEVAILEGHQHRVDDVCFLPDGNTLVSVGVDQLRVWRAASFEETDRAAFKR